MTFLYGNGSLELYATVIGVGYGSGHAYPIHIVLPGLVQLAPSVNIAFYVRVVAGISAFRIEEQSCCP